MSAQPTRHSITQYLAATGVVLVITAAYLLVTSVFGLEAVRENLDEVYILGVVVVATRGGPAPAVWASVLSLLCWRYLMVPFYDAPPFSRWQMMVSLPVFMIVAVLAGHVAAAGRRRELEAQARERETAALYELSLAATSATDGPKLFNLLGERVREVCRVRQCSFWQPSERGEWNLIGTVGDGDPPVLAGTTRTSIQNATNPALFSIGGLVVLPLRADDQLLGAMVVCPSQAEDFPTAGERRMLQAAANHASLCLLRDELNRRASEARANLEAERLKASLLSSVSHDLRTPLSSIKANATTLVARDVDLDEPTRLGMAQSIVDSADRLNAFVGNLLDISRLEAGAWQPMREAFPLIDILSSVLGRFNEVDAERIRIDLEPELPLITVDGPQMEQVLWNLLENAFKYAPAGSAVHIHAHADEAWLKVSVRDHGNSIPVAQRTDIFRKFYRVASEGGPPGLGVGLAICKAAVEVHGGRIWVEDAEDGQGGAQFTFILPLDSPRPTIAAEKSPADLVAMP